MAMPSWSNYSMIHTMYLYTWIPISLIRFHAIWAFIKCWCLSSAMYLPSCQKAKYSVPNKWLSFAVYRLCPDSRKCFIVCVCLHMDVLTHWGWDKMAAISQVIHSNAFYWMKMYKCINFVPQGPINSIPALNMVSISLGFPYMVMLQTFKRNRHCSECGIAMGCYGRSVVPVVNILWCHNAMAIIVSQNTRGLERDTYQWPGNANSRRSWAVNQSMTCWISMWFVTYLCWITPYI